jgi:RND family efflux transporter MFP subunit
MNIRFITRHFRILLIIGVGLLILSQTPFGQRLFKGQPLPQTQKVEKKKPIRSFTASGNIEASKKASLHFLTSGKVVWVGVEKGTDVSKGQALVSLDTTELQASFRQAEQDFISAKAEVEKVYDETGRKTDESFSDKVKRTAAEAKQNKAFDSMKKIEKQMQDATLFSPINGVVTDISLSLGENINTSETIEIVDPSSLYFKAEVDETDYSRVFIDQKVRILLDAFRGKIFNGKVIFIGHRTEVTSSGVSFVPVEIVIDSNKKIIDGLTGEAEFIENE